MTATTCSLEPFLYPATPQPSGGLETTGAGASAAQVNDQALEGYLARLLEAACNDLSAIIVRLDAIEARLTALEEA